MCYSLLLALACALSMAAATADTTPAEIPLNEVWALKSPGTRNIRELERSPSDAETLTKAERTERSLVEHSRWLLNSNFRPTNGTAAQAGFVVAGRGLEALRAAHDVFADRAERQEFVPADTDLSLVFYSYSCGRDVLLDEITREGETITVKYHFFANELRVSRPNVALIPLGHLPVGKHRVVIERLPDLGRDGAVKPLDKLIARSTVCDSFTFVVVEPQ
jgi:hypothetical protein